MRRIGLILMTFGWGWALVGLIDILLGGEGPFAVQDLHAAGEALFWTFVLLSYFILYWIPGILCGMAGTFLFRKGSPDKTLFFQ